MSLIWNLTESATPQKTGEGRSVKDLELEIELMEDDRKGQLATGESWR